MARGEDTGNHPGRKVDYDSRASIGGLRKPIPRSFQASKGYNGQPVAIESRDELEGPQDDSWLERRYHQAGEVKPDTSYYDAGRLRRD